jgi:hypothetical protein
MSNPYATQGYLNKLKKQTRELLAAAHDVLDNWEEGDLALAMRELAAAVAETEELLRK